MNQFKDKVVIVTGGAQGIGKCIADEFRKEGAIVCMIDKAPAFCPSTKALSPQRREEEHFVGDISKKEVLEEFVRYVIEQYGKVDYIINNAMPLFKGINECTYEEFMYAQQVGVVAPFYLVKLLKDNLGESASIVNISSSRDRMSMPQTESYTAAKGGIAALTHALAVSLAGKARVNSISPGWIETSEDASTASGYTEYAGPDATQQPVGRVGTPMDIANMVLFICSDKAGFITGENICIDGGMTKQMIYHGEYGWSYSTYS